MIKIGLTGSIGMGKSTVLSMFGALGAAIWDADAAVHRLYDVGGRAVGPIGEAFPTAIKGNCVDRATLANLVLSDPAAIQKLEAIVHPLVWEDRELFLSEAASLGAKAAILDIPLLFENGMVPFFDWVVVVSTDEDTQRERVLARPGMSVEKLNAILSRQMPDAEKREKADFVIDSGQSMEDMRKQVGGVYDAILSRSAKE